MAEGRRNSNTQLLEELEALSQSLYESHTSTTTRRTASLVLPRTSIPPLTSVLADSKNDEDVETEKLNPKPRSRRMSLSPWRSRPKLGDDVDRTKLSNQKDVKKLDDKDRAGASQKKGGLWNWKPIRALSHIGMQKISCLLSVEVVTVQGLPASMNGLRLSVCVRKKETKESAVQTMPSRVSQGAADFEETLFIRSHVYCTPRGGGSSQMKFEPRPFLIYVFAVDAEELDFGTSTVDLSILIQESIEKSREGARIRQWNLSFDLSGKAKGGELVLKLGFQIMEKDGGIGIYSQGEGEKSGKSRNILSSSSSSSYARRQSKSSFSVPSPRLNSRAEAWTPSQKGVNTEHLQGIDELNLDEPAPLQKTDKKPEPQLEDLDQDLPEFDVVDKGVEIQDKGGVESEDNSDKRSVSSEVVKEIVHDQVHLTRLTELDSIAQQIKALESMMGEEKPLLKTDEDTKSQRLDAEEETVTREFLQLLEVEDANLFKINENWEVPTLKLEGDNEEEEAESEVFLPDLGKGLGCVVQTRNGGFLAAMNPLDAVVSKGDTPKLAMQLSKPMVIPSSSANGFGLLQKMAGAGLEELSSDILSLMPMDELVGKTAEQIAFEGIASAIIQGRSKEGASSSAARTVAAVKTMVKAMGSGQKERISTGIWNLSEDPLTVDEILAFSMQKMETMAVEGLKIQADMSEEEAPFAVSPLNTKGSTQPLASSLPLDEWVRDGYTANTITVSVVVQLRDPSRQFEAVGGPMIALIHGTRIDAYEEEKRFKVASLVVGGFRVRDGGKKNVWDSEKQRLTAIQWLMAYGLGKVGKKGKRAVSKGPDSLWSVSSRVMADMWLKSIRNPDVKLSM